MEEMYLSNGTERKTQQMEETYHGTVLIAIPRIRIRYGERCDTLNEPYLVRRRGSSFFGRRQSDGGSLCVSMSTVKGFYRLILHGLMMAFLVQLA